MPVGKPLKSREIDEKDKKILMLLQEDGRMQLSKISKKVNLSIDAVHKRIKEMKRRGIFEVKAIINPTTIGYPLIADIKIKLKNVSKAERDSFIKYLQENKRCVELFSTMGDYDFTCVLVAKNNIELEEISIKIREDFKDLIREWKGLLSLKTYKFEEYDLL